MRALLAAVSRGGGYGGPGERARTAGQCGARFVAGVVAGGIPERFGRRLTRDEVEKLLVDTKLDAQMKAFAQWEDFEAGRRGVNR